MGQIRREEKRTSPIVIIERISPYCQEKSVRKEFMDDYVDKKIINRWDKYNDQDFV